MDIAVELQQEASQRAGSPEGFQRVIHLVLESIERGETDSPLFVLPNTRPEWMWPEQYLPTFREYVCLMQQVLSLRRQSKRLQNVLKWSAKPDPVDYLLAKDVQRQLNDTIHEAKKTSRELPIHAYKRLRAMEVRYSVKFGGSENLYLPANWEFMSEIVEAAISNFGTGREDVGLNHDKESSYGDC